MKKTIIIAAALVAMTACNKNIINEQVAAEAGYGYIALGVTADTEMVVAKADTPDLTGYNVTLKKGEDVVWGPEEYGSIEADAWKVEAGNYTIYVENLTVAETYATEPGVVRVTGQNDVTVTAGVSTSCTVNCRPANSKVSFMYSPEFDVVFDEPAVSVKESDARTVEMTVGESHLEANAAYFEPGTLTWTLTAKLGGETKTYSKDFTTVKAKWTQVTFTTGSTDGQIQVTITVDGEITEVETITATIDPITGDIE